MNATVLYAGLPITDWLKILATAVVVTLLLCLLASWLIDNALLPALRGLPLVRPWSERRWPAGGRHLANGDDDGGQAGGVRELRQADQDAAEVEGHLGARRDRYPALPAPDAGHAVGDLSEHHDDWAGGRFTHEGEDDDDGPPRVLADDQPAMVASGPVAVGRRADAPEDSPGDLVPVQRSDRALPVDDATARHDSERSAPAAEIDDLTTDDAYDTDTLRIFHEANEQHLVPAHEPDPPGPAAEVRKSVPEGTASPLEPGRSMEGSGPGAFKFADCGYIDGCIHTTWCRDRQRCVDFTSPPGPDEPSLPGETAPLDVDTPTGTGPGALFSRLLRRNRPAVFWTAARLELACQTDALLALAESILAGGAA